MFREMKRKEKRIMDEREAKEILEKGSFGIMALRGDEGYAYGVPLSYIYEDNTIYFHSAKEGQKIDAIKKNHKVSFTVVAKDNVIPEKFTTEFKSVIAFGRAEIIRDQVEKKKAMVALCKKYSPGYEQEALAYIEKAWEKFFAIKITVEHLSAKGV